MNFQVPSKQNGGHKRMVFASTDSQDHSQDLDGWRIHQMSVKQNRNIKRPGLDFIPKEY